MDKNVPSKRIKAAYRRAFKSVQLELRPSLKAWAVDFSTHQKREDNEAWRRNKKRARGRKA